jgi:putative colanic acid biosynthesis UDP-glucose lipid carrier transferase
VVTDSNVSRIPERAAERPPSVPRSEPPDEAPISAPPSAISPQAVRITPVRQSSRPPAAEEPIVVAVLDILLAAAESDGEVCRRELRAIRHLARALMKVEELPSWVEQHISDFDYEKFDVSKTVQALSRLPFEEKRHIVELARRVCDANNAYDLEEEHFLLGMVIALELSPEETEDLVLHTTSAADGLAKRLFDIVFSASVLLLGFPFLFIIGLAVKFTSPGPMLFCQRRYGMGGREIRVFKFRTMAVTEDGPVVRQATVGDPRITPLGHFLRRTSIDEFPQFLNVLLGNMSVVGPRPHAVAHNQLYRTQILEYMLRHKVKPGITGLAQVRGWRGETDTLDKMVGRVSADLEYIRHQSFWLDLSLVWQTVFGRSAHEHAR